MDPTLDGSDSLAPRPWLIGGLVTLWLAGAIAGLAAACAYDNTLGVAANAPIGWPSHTTLARATDRPTLVLLAHPQCSCTNATLGELAEALVRAKSLPPTYVVEKNRSALSIHRARDTHAQAPVAVSVAQRVSLDT